MIASAIIGLLGTAASGVMSAINNKKAQDASDAEYARQQAHYDALASENPLARSENQALLGEYDRAAKKQVETERSRNKILGATPEADIALQGRVAEGRASLMSGMAQNASNRADKARESQELARQSKAEADQARYAARNETYAALAANAANSIGSLIDSKANALAANAANSIGSLVDSKANAPAAGGALFDEDGNPLNNTAAYQVYHDNKDVYDQKIIDENKAKVASKAASLGFRNHPQ